MGRTPSRSLLHLQSEACDDVAAGHLTVRDRVEKYIPGQNPPNCAPIKFDDPISSVSSMEKSHLQGETEAVQPVGCF
jgi:hypothetical protein